MSSQLLLSVEIEHFCQKSRKNRGFRVQMMIERSLPATILDRKIMKNNKKSIFLFLILFRSRVSIALRNASTRPQNALFESSEPQNATCYLTWSTQNGMSPEYQIEKKHEQIEIFDFSNLILSRSGLSEPFRNAPQHSSFEVRGTRIEYFWNVLMRFWVLWIP